MNCLHCGKEISDSFFEKLSRSHEFKGGRFACPDCGADHVRRNEGKLPSGAPLYTYRLWGHVSLMRRNPSPPDAGAERRKSARSKRWR